MSLMKAKEIAKNKRLQSNNDNTKNKINDNPYNVAETYTTQEQPMYVGIEVTPEVIMLATEIAKQMIEQTGGSVKNIVIPVTNQRLAHDNPTVSADDDVRKSLQSVERAKLVALKARKMRENAERGGGR